MIHLVSDAFVKHCPWWTWMVIAHVLHQQLLYPVVVLCQLIVLSAVHPLLVFSKDATVHDPYHDDHAYSCVAMPAVACATECPGSCYKAICDAFEQNQRATCGRLMIINPLHKGLPKLVVLFQATCNRFDAVFVREQWQQVSQLWQPDMAAALGPLLGHASDGDARRRALQLEDYHSPKTTPYMLPAPGFTFSASVSSANGETGCHAEVPTMRCVW
jgi:hypothetical protein